MDKRSEARIPHNLKFFVHIHECVKDPSLVGESIACEAVDFSPNGLQFRSDQALAPRTLLNITVGIGEKYSMYLLRGEVRWVRGVDGANAMGVLLQDVPDTNFASWGEDFDKIFN